MAGTAVPYQKGGVQVTIGKPNQVEVPPAIFRCRLTGLLFDTNKTFLLPLAFRGMKVLKKLFAAHSNLGILVNGHTDRVGGPAPNLKLSEERAKSIEAFLKDDADFWMQFYNGRPGSAAWGTTEDKKMLEAVGAASAKEFQQANGITPANGTMNAATRKKLVQKYMEQDGSPLPKDAHLETHGCGEFHNEVPTADDVAEQRNRRVELFLFDPEIGPRPRPTCPSPDGCPEYDEWKKQTVFTVDLDQAMGTLAVQVTDDAKKLLAGAKVHISGPLPDDGTTNDKGVVTFPDVIPGTYRVTADKEGFKAGSAQVVVKPDEGGSGANGGGGGGGASSDPAVVVLQSGTGDLTVVVTNGVTGAAIPGATVDLETPTGPQKGLKTDGSGNLTLTATPAGDYFVTVSLGGFDTAGPTKVSVGPNSNAGLAVKLAPVVKTGSLTIVVTDGSSKAAIAGATVDLTTPNGPQNGLKTDASGALTLDPTPTGSYGVTVSKDAFVKSSTKVTVGVSNTVHSVKLTPAVGKLTVTVKDQDGAAIVDAIVSVADLNLSSKSDASGLVDFGDVAAGQHTIKVEKDGFGPDAKKVAAVEVKTTVKASANNAVPVKMTTVPVVFQFTKMAVPKVIAPGAETVKITYEIDDPKGILAKGKLEILDSKSKVLSTRDLTADERKTGSHEIAWKGQTLGAEAPPEFPGGFLTVELSPYTLKLSGATADGKQTSDKAAPVEVQLAEVTLELGPKTFVTDARDQKLHDTLGGKIPAAGSTQRIELLSNLFKTSTAEMAASSTASFVQYRDDATYGWGDGPRIPIVAKVTFNASDGKKLLAPKAWGKRRLLWDWEPVAENTGALAAKVKTFVETARDYEATKTKPKGKLTHKDRGGKRSLDGTPAVFLQASTFETKTGTKRVWAVFTGPADGGAEDGKTGVLFRPGRQSGDGWKVTAHFEPDPTKDLDVEAAVTAKVSKATGTFEVWRKVEIVKYIKKRTGVPNVTEATIKGHYDKAFLNLTFPAAKKTMSDAGEVNYNTTFATEYATIMPNPNFQSAWVDPAVDQMASGDHAVEFRQFAAFKSTAIANRQAQLVAGGAAAPAALTQATTEVNNALSSASLNSVGEHATHCAKNLGDQIAKAVAKHYVSTADGITLLQFKDDCNLVALSGWAWYGFAPTFAGQGRTKSAFLLYGVPATHSTNNEDQVAHEIGHLLFLVHSPAPLTGTNAPGGADPAAHDQTDTGPCNQSYDHAAPHHFCGLCNLRLRGWDHTKLDKDGTKNKKT